MEFLSRERPSTSAPAVWWQYTQMLMRAVHWRYTVAAHTHTGVRGQPGEHVNHAGRVLLLLRRFSCGLDLFSFLRTLSGRAQGKASAEIGEQPTLLLLLRPLILYCALFNHQAMGGRACQVILYGAFY